MNQERQKTDAIADAVEIPEGATHYYKDEYDLYYYKVSNFSLFQFVNNEWMWVDLWDSDYYSDLILI